jgi:branched-chain amino acid transport system permease protein
MTIALTLVVSQLAMSWSSFTGGDAGLVGVPPIRLKLSNFYYSFDSDLATYFLSLMLATTVLLTLWFVCRGNYGKILSAIENDEIRAQTLGINTNLHILVVFIVSAILAALSGAIFASFSGFVAPDIAGIILSTEVILWVMVGGRGTFIGPVLGAILIMKIQQEISSVSTSLWPFVLGIFFVIIVFVLPNGLLPLIRRIILRLGEKTRTFGYSKPDATRD